MESLASILKRSFEEMGIGTPVFRNQVFFYWDRVVGPRIAAEARPERLEGGRLFVKVKSAVWRNELIFLRQDIVKRLNDRIGQTVIDEMILI